MNPESRTSIRSRTSRLTLHDLATAPAAIHQAVASTPVQRRNESFARKTPAAYAREQPPRWAKLAGQAAKQQSSKGGADVGPWRAPQREGKKQQYGKCSFSSITGEIKKNKKTKKKTRQPTEHPPGAGASSGPTSPARLLPGVRPGGHMQPARTHNRAWLEQGAVLFRTSSRWKRARPRCLAGFPSPCSMPESADGW